MPKPTTQRSPHTPSHIPVVASCPSRSTLPSSLSLPQLSLVPPSRRVSISGSSTPVYASPASTSSTSTVGTNTPGSSIPSFRSLRNLLAFGPTKSQTASSNGPSANGSKSPFASFGSVRRSMTVERKNSISRSRSEELDESPVISIEASPEMKRSRVETDQGKEDPFRVPLFRSSVDKELPSTPGPPLSTDLSTILEAENSGISKHIPTIDDSQDLEAGVQTSSSSSDSEHYVSAQATREPIDLALLHTGANGVDKRRGDGHGPNDSRDASALDLSTSQLAAEVLDAITVKDQGSPGDWLNGVDGVVVDDAPDIITPPVDVIVEHSEDDGRKRDANLSFNLSALDPDLAALLSPNRMSNSDPTITGTVDLIPPPLTPARTSPVSPSSPIDGLSAPRIVGSQSSPVRRRSASFSRSRHPPSSSLPRLARSVTGHLSPTKSDKDLASPTSAQTSPERSSFDDHGRRASSDSMPKRRTQPPSPLSAHGHSVTSRPNTGGESYPHKPVQSRIATPVRLPSSYTSSNSRPPLRHAATASSANFDGDSVSPTSRASSSLGTAAATRRSHHPRPSIDNNVRPSTADRERTLLIRNRKRSMSVEGSSPESMPSYKTPAPSTRPSSSMSGGRPATEWLGPRTAKAFAAAGLLDFDREGVDGPGSRFGASRSVSERDMRYTPSRTAFSEASGSNVSWGRSRSASHTMTMSEAGHPLTESPTFSTPRTAFSGASTAPTSVSASSSAQQHLQATLQNMKEKHDVETEALLSALSDSQRTTKVLREENGDLRERIQDLERQLDDANNYIRRLESTPPVPLAHTLPRRAIDRRPRAGSMDGLHRRSQLRMEVFVPPDRDSSPEPFSPPESERDLPSSETFTKAVESPAHSAPKRLSTASSIFHLPPSNMSMLLHEEGNMSDRSGAFSTSSMSRSPPSPTLVIPKRTGSVKHGRNRSMSSGNISPTTASFSMTEMTGSPGSLYLRPEHEIHLGDMTSFTLDHDGGE